MVWCGVEGVEDGLEERLLDLFLLDYAIDEEEWGGRKKPHRYCWPDDIRDEVLARLLDLNADRPRRRCALAWRRGRIQGPGGHQAGASRPAVSVAAESRFPWGRTDE